MMRVACRSLMPVAQRRGFELEKDREIRRAFHYAMKECGVPEGGELPPEKFSLFSQLMAEQIMKFLRRYQNRRRVDRTDE